MILNTHIRSFFSTRPAGARSRQLWRRAPANVAAAIAGAPAPSAATGAAPEPVQPSAAAATAAPLLAPLDIELLTEQQRQGEHQQPAAWVPPLGRPGLYDSDGRLVLKSLTLPELEAWCAAEGEPHPANRALQLWRWMYADPPAGHWVRRLEDTAGRQNGFSAKFIEKVGPRVTLDGGLQLSEVVRAADGTRKLVFRLTGGEAAGGSVETVLIPIVRQQGLRDRLTICVSSQVGCAMNCQFCYTGRMGLLGNLTTAQIVEQVVEARRFLAEEGDPTQLTNLVFMGMGEPLHNTEAVLAAADIISHYLGLHISHNKITISTVGLVPELRRVVAHSRVQVALSLHATTDEVRDWLVPVNRRYDLATLVASLEELFPRAGGDRSVLIGYTMLHGINDTLEDAERLAAMLSRVLCKVNLIVFNPHRGTRFQPSRPDDVAAFRSALVQRGLVCTIRDSRGDDEMAACGQLGNVGLAFRPSPILEAPERFWPFLLPPPPLPAAPPVLEPQSAAA